MNIRRRNSPAGLPIPPNLRLGTTYYYFHSQSFKSKCISLLRYLRSYLPCLLYLSHWRKTRLLSSENEPHVSTGMAMHSCTCNLTYSFIAPVSNHEGRYRIQEWLSTWVTVSFSSQSPSGSPHIGTYWHLLVTPLVNYHHLHIDNLLLFDSLGLTDSDMRDHYMLPPEG